MTDKKKPAGKWHAVLRDDGKRYVSVTAAAVSVAAAKSTISAACRDGSMVGGYKPVNGYSVYKGDVNDTDAVIQFTKDALIKRWNTRGEND